MAVYRGKYQLEGLSKISPEMERDLDLAYDICMSYRGTFPCEMCGRCCHQPNIIVRPEEVERVASAAGTDLYTFMTQYVYQTSDGRILVNKREDGPCPFLGRDRRCTIWKDRPEICDDFPYLVSKFMSRVYLALVNPDADVVELLDYMDGEWPCTGEILSTIAGKVEEGRRVRAARLSGA